MAPQVLWGSAGGTGPCISLPPSSVMEAEFQAGMNEVRGNLLIPAPAPPQVGGATRGAADQEYRALPTCPSRLMGEGGFTLGGADQEHLANKTGVTLREAGTVPTPAPSPPRFPVVALRVCSGREAVQGTELPAHFGGTYR